ncbi:hypothetical protein EJ04DRAFT_566217 [Polyplosphaeria fusca]|uniref:Uncharacterized protein n=1 Tax=Polyplosphaeria fusca TaxID=682080 RepID=A0A9P4QW04_9PLEO|nr:hypothetical protein EJ04DRAFT_566217 [Polyplosphaeria fusca]
MNDESKARRVVKSVMLGKAKVMTWEDLEKARGEHAAKEAAKVEKKAKTTAREAKKVAKTALRLKDAATGEEKRGRKRMAATSGTDPLEPRAKVARINDGQIKQNEAITEP